MINPKIASNQTTWYQDTSGNPLDDSSKTNKVERQGMTFSKARRKTTLAGVFNRTIQYISKPFRKQNNESIFGELAQSMTIVNPAPKAAPTPEAAKAPTAPSVKKPKIEVPPYDASELTGPVFTAFQKKNAAAREKLQTKHLAGFSDTTVKAYEAVYNASFPLDYAIFRRQTKVATDALTMASKRAEEAALTEFLMSDNPEHCSYGEAMLQCKAKIAFKKNSASITYKRTVPASAAEEKPKETTPIKPAGKPAKPAIAPKPVMLNKPPIAPKPVMQNVSFTPSPKLDNVADRLEKFVSNSHPHQENSVSVIPRRTARPMPR